MWVIFDKSGSYRLAGVINGMITFTTSREVGDFLMFEKEKQLKNYLVFRKIPKERVSVQWIGSLRKAGN